jgi:hypothetical protein
MIGAGTPLTNTTLLSRTFYEKFLNTLLFKKITHVISSCLQSILFPYTDYSTFSMTSIMTQKTPQFSFGISIIVQLVSCSLKTF